MTVKTMFSKKNTTFFIAAVWLINGLFCKVLNLVPRHREIVARILGERYATPLTQLIGWAEVGLTIWIVSGIKSRWSAVLQMVIVAMMNILEFILTPGLLLWRRTNIVFATLFIGLIYFNEFGEDFNRRERKININN